MSFPAEFEIADTMLKRARGLIFRNKIEKPLLFILPSESRESGTIHSFFVAFPFDAVFLNSKGIVVDIRENIQPFTLRITPAKPAKYIIELRAGAVRRRKIGIGSKLLRKAYI